MERRTHRGGLEAALLGMAAAMAAFFAGRMDVLAAEGVTPHLPLLGAGFAGLILLFLALIPRLRLPETLLAAEERHLLILLVAALLPRILWGTAAPARMDSDYGLYVRLGAEFAARGVLAPDPYLLAIAPNVSLYAAILGLLMRVFGTGAATAQGFCMLLHVGNIFLLYGIGKQLTSPRRAFLAALLFALLPENVFYSTLPGIEALSMATMLAGLWLVLRAGRNGRGSGLRLSLAGGAMLGLSACIRASAWAAVAAGVLLIGRSGRGEEKRKRRLAFLGMLALGIGAVVAGYQLFQRRVYEGVPPAGGLGWPLYEGLDLPGAGRWTEEKSRRCIEVIFAYSPAEADRIFLREALERFGGYSLTEKLRLFLRKGGVFWYDSEYSVFALEGTLNLPLAKDIATGSWTVCLAAWIAGLLLRWRTPLDGNARRSCGALLLLILLTNLWHEAGTSIGRYHYMLIPFVFLLTVLLAPGKAPEDGDQATRMDGNTDSSETPDRGGAMPCRPR